MRRVSLLALVLLAVACSAGGSSPRDPDVHPDVAPEVATDVATDATSDVTDAASDVPGQLDLPHADLAEADPGQADPATADVAAPDLPEPAPDTVELPEVAPDALDPGPLPGFGLLSGECGVFDDAVWASSEPRFFVNHLDFAADGYDDADHDLLTPGGQKIIDDPNAGGSSKPSEAFAFEVLARCELAILLKTELPIDYVDEQGKITDLLVQIDDRKVGVSVTRAMSWPLDAPYPPDTADKLLVKKLEGIQASTANVKPNDAWVRQVLSVLATDDAHAQVLHDVWAGLPADLRGDTLLLVTVTDGDDVFLY